MTTDPAALSHAGIPPWETGRPQPAVRALAEAGELRGRLLDLGCGSGQNAAVAAGAGADVIGIDIDPTALAAARETSELRGLHVCFRELDVLDLDNLGKRAFDVFLDSLLFHMLPPPVKKTYFDKVTALAASSARLFLIAYAAAQSDVPHHLEPAEARSWFEPQWQLKEASSIRIQTRRHFDGAAGWLYSLRLRERRCL
jgi:SAM-dependent methyltransferase